MENCRIYAVFIAYFFRSCLLSHFIRRSETKERSRSGSLRRKTKFLVVPYGESTDSSEGVNIAKDGTLLDKPLKVFSISKQEDNRRKRREAAMRKTEMALQNR